MKGFYVKAFVARYKGQKVDAVIERVLAGDRMLARLMLSPTRHVQTLITLAGIKAPATSRTNPTDGKVQPAEPHGQEAFTFTESRLTHRRIEFEILGLTPQGVLVGAIHHPRGNIAEHLLREGLARCFDPHSEFLGAGMSALRHAEREAKDARPRNRRHGTQRSQTPLHGVPGRHQLHHE